MIEPGMHMHVVGALQKRDVEIAIGEPDGSLAAAGDLEAESVNVEFRHLFRTVGEEREMPDLGHAGAPSVISSSSSLPRERESRRHRAVTWIPAFAGMT